MINDLTAFRLYLIFVISFFLHLPARLSILGVVRFDLMMVLLIFVILFYSKNNAKPINFDKNEKNKTATLIKLLLIYILVTIPIVRWPGTVFSVGLPGLIKAMVFFFFTISLITTEKRLKIFIFVFLVCQILRILEPLYMNQVDGYWGSQTYMGGEMMDRLSGSPYDVINANGLAFVIVSVLPFLYYTTLTSKFKYKIIFFAIAPLLLYALILTASRTGLLALLVIFVGMFIKSKRKFIYIICTILALLIIIPNLTELQRDRYLSIYSSDVPGASTTKGRFEGVKSDFMVAMQRPLFGHGIGTSLEANTHVAGSYMRAHDLYAEIMQELGLVGLVIFLFFIKEIIYNFRTARKALRKKLEQNTYLTNILNAMQIWLAMNILFSFASYGLSSYEWYLFGGLSVVIKKLATEPEKKAVPKKDENLSRKRLSY